MIIYIIIMCIISKKMHFLANLSLKYRKEKNFFLLKNV